MARSKFEGKSVSQPLALSALQRWIDRLDSRTRERGRAYYLEDRVHSVRAPGDHYIEGTVEGGSEYQVTLFLRDRSWSSRCTCPVGNACKHAVALAVEWLAHGGAPSTAAPGETRSRSAQLQPIPEVPAPPPPPISPDAFVETWAPVLEQKLGRPLWREDRMALDQLARLFGAFSTAGELSAVSLRRYGFEGAIPPDAKYATYPLSGWWTEAAKPTDPWALWQFLAYSLQIQGKPIPAVFQPLTDTNAVGDLVDAGTVDKQIRAWQHALAGNVPTAPRGNALKQGATAFRAIVIPKGLTLETLRSPGQPWKSPTQQWLDALYGATAGELNAFSPPEAALATAILAHRQRPLHSGTIKFGLPEGMVSAILSSDTARQAVVLPDGTPFAIEPVPLEIEAQVSTTLQNRLHFHLVTPGGRSASGASLITAVPENLYLHDGRVWRGPPPVPELPLPIAALSNPQIASGLRAVGVRLPKSVEAKRRRVRLKPVLQIKVRVVSEAAPEFLEVRLVARSDDPPTEHEYHPGGAWIYTDRGAPPRQSGDQPFLDFDYSAANEAAGHLVKLGVYWQSGENYWTRPITRDFPDDLLAWHASLPAGVSLEAGRDLAALFQRRPVRAHVDFGAKAADSRHDWFDVSVGLRIEDTKLDAEEIALLLKARGRWVRLPRSGWQRLEVSVENGEAAKMLDRIGVSAVDVLATGRTSVHRLHALQLASAADALEARDAALGGQLRERLARIRAMPRATVPASLKATLRPYQQDGFAFLAHLSALGFGGVLADDMGLGKTVQSLAWLIHLAEAKDGKEPFRALVVCPKSVTQGWLTETSRFAPTLHAAAFAPTMVGRSGALTNVSLLVANYTQLRLNAPWFQAKTWDAVILDEGQFIKNPTSQVAVAARGLHSSHRLVLTGTPVENRLSDLWSLFAFAQPGVLGTQAAFRRDYSEDVPESLARLQRRVSHFLLRRTKAQAAPDLPPRTEDDLLLDLEPAQRKLYDAELKRARQQLLGIQSDRAFDEARFNILASLLRLRQICCHPALIDPAHANLPSAKLDALLELVEELREEGHQVLVFSQFVQMLDIIRSRLAKAGIGHLMLTGATENRAELVDTFQADRSKTVFLLSIKAAGFGLNLTAASYAILYDPWWNPAVEAQAIDRTHRIGQTRPVIAYRLLARDTVEEKIRALQQEKAALAASVVQEESLARVLDLASLRQILG